MFKMTPLLIRNLLHAKATRTLSPGDQTGLRGDPGKTVLIEWGIVFSAPFAP